MTEFLGRKRYVASEVSAVRRVRGTAQGFCEAEECLRPLLEQWGFAVLCLARGGHPRCRGLAGRDGALRGCDAALSGCLDEHADQLGEDRVGADRGGTLVLLAGATGWCAARRVRRRTMGGLGRVPGDRRP